MKSLPARPTTAGRRVAAALVAGASAVTLLGGCGFATRQQAAAVVNGHVIAEANVQETHDQLQAAKLDFSEDAIVMGLIAGPLAGFVFAVPALFVGIAMSPIARVPEDLIGYNLGEPLLFKIAARLTWGALADGYSLNLHPMAFAAWFGLLATALNLFPIGQLDGGHISYAVLGRRSTAVTLGAICVAIGLTFFSVSWLVWTVLLVAMTLAMGPRHPSTMDEDIPLGQGRIWLAVVALLILVMCFTYNPIEPTQLLGSQ